MFCSFSLNLNVTYERVRNHKNVVVLKQEYDEALRHYAENVPPPRPGLLNGSELCFFWNAIS